MSTLSVSVVLVVGLAALAVACAEPRPKGLARTVASQPHAADRYARILERQLTDSNAQALEQERVCEFARMSVALGVDEAELRAYGVEDTVYRTPDARARHAKVRTAVSGRSYETSGPVCDSLNAIADREAPLAK